MRGMQVSNAGLSHQPNKGRLSVLSVALLEKGVPLDVVSMLLGPTSIKTTEKHYAPWVKSRQTAFEDAVKLAWA
jgi:integrase